MDWHVDYSVVLAVFLGVGEVLVVVDGELFLRVFDESEGAVDFAADTKVD